MKSLPWRWKKKVVRRRREPTEMAKSKSMPVGVGPLLDLLQAWF